MKPRASEECSLCKSSLFCKCSLCKYTNEMCLISGTWHGRTNAMQCGNGKKSKILDHAPWSCCVYSGVDEASKITPRSFAIRAVCHQLHPAHDQCTVTVRHLDLDCVPNMALQRGVVCSACNAMHTRHRTFWYRERQETHSGTQRHVCNTRHL